MRPRNSSAKTACAVLLLSALTALAAHAQTFSVLYNFPGGTNGESPSNLIADSSGNLYGTTQYGGIISDLCFGVGCGVVFKLDPLGNETVLYRFTGRADGAQPAAGLIRDSA